LNKFLRPSTTHTTNSLTAFSAYRFHFNGMERDDEVVGGGNSYTTEFRQYDSRIGRWLSIDPQFRNYPWQSPYAALDNNPIVKIDPRGDAPGDGDPEKTKEAAGNSVSNIKATDPQGSQPPRCNQGVAGAFQEITGSTELNGMRANEMKNHMANSPNFTPIPMSEAQEAANNGDVVIAAWENPTGASGHVAMVVPGEASTQGTWEGQPAATYGGIPKVMDTGAGMRTVSQSVNKSFGKLKQGDVVFYKYTPALSIPNTKEIAQQTTQTVVYSNPITGQTYKFEQKQFILKAAPDAKLSEYMLNSSAPIIRDLGAIAKKIGF
jgi:RHS repeat-associated protein